MSYQVIARKWRPQTFDEVVYQDHVSRTIRNSIKNGRISHAYLFSGPRGVGKTTMARIVAKSLNCIDGPTSTPCGKCENCVEIKQGNSFDVIEIDGASNNGIDNIRELRENVNFAPAKSRYKIYIIDEVHMVTTAAFNALLKTLEEPPAHVIFIFATTEIHKIPDTILSRCQKYFFKKIPIDVVVTHLASIVAKEGYRISQGALYPVARIADGSMRDAQSLLEQVISFSGASVDGIEISEDDALSILGVVPTESYAKLIELVSMADASGLMAEVDHIVSMGIDVSRYSAGFMDIIRYVRLINAGVDVKSMLGLSVEETGLLSSSGKRLGDYELGALFRIASELVKNLRFSGNDRVYLEMALMDMVSVIETPSISEIIKKLEDSGVTASVTERPRTAPVPAAEPQKKTESAAGPDVLNAWNDMLAEFDARKNRLYYILRPALTRCTGGKIILNYPEGIDSSTYSKSLDSKTVSFIEKNLSERLGTAIVLELDMKPSGTEAVQAPPGKEKRGEIPEPDDSPLPEAEMDTGPEKNDQDAESHAVKRIQNAFYGQIVKKENENA
ncbi:MAG TPA: DNA polymerase III subunit gamma/tau [Spirochaetota bacterium]|nr:DNA polymerase III subunit gamma/tau [Spirochaetota bacterium]